MKMKQELYSKMQGNKMYQLEDDIFQIKEFTPKLIPHGFTNKCQNTLNPKENKHNSFQLSIKAT